MDSVLETLEVVWRVLVIMLGASLAGQIIFGFVYRDKKIRCLPPERRLAWAGVLVFIFQNVIVQIGRFNDEMTLVGTPLSTIAFVIFWLAIRRIEVPKKSRATVDNPPPAPSF